MLRTVEAFDRTGLSVHYNEPRPYGINPKTTVPTMRIGSVLDLAISNNTFAYYKNYKNVGYHPGLKEFIRSSFGERNTPVTFMDNHVHAFYAWSEALLQGRINPGATLIHIDQHHDARKMHLPDVNIENLAEVYTYVRSRLHIDSFIVPARTKGIIKRVFWVKPISKDPFIDNLIGIPDLGQIGIEDDLIEDIISGKKDPMDVILDLDLDYFNLFYENPNMVTNKRGARNIEDLIEHDIGKIRLLAANAGIITVATSPSFIDQEKAIELAKKIFK